MKTKLFLLLAMLGGSFTGVNAESNLPRIDINIENNAEVVEKDVYLKATVTIDGKGQFENFSDSTYIKGRGNSTWNRPKKPYRLKLYQKGQPFGLKKAKNWALLANYVDRSMTQNAVAMKVAEILDLPFRNHMIPVDLYINGTFRGNYTFTEKIGIDKNSVDIDKNTGVLLEIDTNYDEPYKFISSTYKMPVMIKDPDWTDLNDNVQANANKDAMKVRFDAFEKAVAAGDDLSSLMDVEGFAKYIFVYDLLCNYEAEWPKSTYIYTEDKDDATKIWNFGPIWDFDWCCGYTETGGAYQSDYTRIASYRGYTSSSYYTNRNGRPFFYDLINNAKIRPIYMQVCEDFLNNHSQEILEFIDDYYAKCADSFVADDAKWMHDNLKSSVAVAKLRKWLEANMAQMRIDYNIPGPAVPEPEYAVNYEADQDYTYVGRHLNGLALSTEADGETAFTIPSGNTKVYNYMSNDVFKVKAGVEVTPTINFTGEWMHNYTYIDLNNDGHFQAKINADGSVPADSCEVVCFSAYSADKTYWYNNAQEIVKNSNRFPAKFTIPAETPYGIYRLRTKMDWNDYDPAGSVVVGNDMLKNGGGIIDFLINIHGDSTNISAVANEQGTITTVDGAALSKAEFGKEYQVKINPATKMLCTGLTLKYGYNLEGDSINEHNNPQYWTVAVDSAEIVDGVYTIPAEYMDGNVQISATFAEDTNYEPDVLYLSHFGEDEAYTYNGRRFYGLTLATEADGSQDLTDTSLNYTYTKLLDKVFKIKAGSEVTPTINYTGEWMHNYTYIDYNNDGEFQATINYGGVVPEGSEVVCFSAYSPYETTFYNNAQEIVKNSNCFPANFTVPAETPHGIYRLRTKMDWNSYDPAGRNDSSNNLRNNGGGLIDYLVNIHGDDSFVTALESENGSVAAAATLAEGDGTTPAALDKTAVPFGKAYTVALNADENYKCTSLVIRHGYNLNGRQYVHENKQWNEETITEGLDGATYEIPAEYIDGDVEIAATFEYVESSAIANADKNAMKVIAGNGFITINTTANTNVVVVDALGRVIAKAAVNGSKTLNVVPGIYIVNNTKVIVR